MFDDELMDKVNKNTNKEVSAFKSGTKLSLSLMFAEGEEEKQVSVLGDLIDEFDSKYKIAEFFGLVSDKNMNALDLHDLWLKNERDAEATINAVREM